MAEEKLRLLVRLGDANLDGKKPIYHELRKVKGVSFMFSNAVLTSLGIDRNIKAGALTDEQIDKLERQLKKPQGLPKWMLNRLGDYETGEDMHLISADIDYTKSNDIKRLKKIKSYRGTRHASRLPSRGQQTKAHFRTKSKKSSGIKKK